MKNIFIILFAVLLSGCMTALTAWEPIAPPVEKVGPVIGKMKTTRLGEPMITKVDAQIFPGFKAIRDFKVPGSSSFTGIYYPTIPAGSVWKCVGKLENGDMACKNDRIKDSQLKDYYCVIIKPTGEAYADDGCIGGYIRKWPRGENIFTPAEVYSEGAFKQEILYNGRTSESIKLAYREFLNDMARPAFFQEMVYDISESNIIGFRGMEIEIFEATNTEISFIVKSNIE